MKTLKKKHTSKNQTKKKAYSSRLYKYSNPRKAQKMAYKYLGKTAKLYPADKKDKKYKIWDPYHNKWVNFGQLGYEDYTKHKNKTRRKSYLSRSTKIKGDWKRNKYSPNNLSIHILW